LGRGALALAFGGRGPEFRRAHAELVAELERLSSTEIDIPLLGARVRMKIPAGTQPGSVFRVRGKGLARGSGGGRGDAHVRISLEVPAQLSDEARGLLEKLGLALPDSAYPRRAAFRAVAAARGEMALRRRSRIRFTRSPVARGDLRPTRLGRWRAVT
jgi:hypothetical protein